LKSKYASDKIGKIKVVQGSRHIYFAITLDFTIPGVLQVNITQYMKRMIQEFPKKLSGKSRCVGRLDRPHLFLTRKLSI
jgi:hypothetical protein